MFLLFSLHLHSMYVGKNGELLHIVAVRSSSIRSSVDVITIFHCIFSVDVR